VFEKVKTYGTKLNKRNKLKDRQIN